MTWPGRHLLALEGAPREELLSLLALAEKMRERVDGTAPRDRALEGKLVLNLFLEPSTRTRSSFEVAAKRLGADVVNFVEAASSTKKGETLLDTARNLDAMGPDIVVVRHASSGAPRFLAQHVSACVVNAGDGMHEHPTQALLDCSTIRRHKGRIEGLTVAIVGDVAHSRVARSNIHALNALGAQVRVVGPRSLLPAGIEALGVRAYDRLAPGLEGADVVMVLRLQQERQTSGLIPSPRDYARAFGVNARTVQLANPDAIVMHPGPINRGVELSPDVADGGRSVILDQVRQGVAVRMAVLQRLAAAAS